MQSVTHKGLMLAVWAGLVEELEVLSQVVDIDGLRDDRNTFSKA